MSNIPQRKCEFCHKIASTVCEVESQSRKCSRMLVKIRQTTLRFIHFLNSIV